MYRGKIKPFLKKFWILFVVLILIVFIVFIKFKLTNANSQITTNTAEVTKGSINVEISSSGVIQPIERYDITPLVTGNIIESQFEETDTVKEGDILYKFDASNLENTLEKSQNNIEKLKINQKSIRDNLEKTIIYAPESGRLSNFNLKVNENISQSKVAEIIEDSYYIAQVPFNKKQTEKMYIGQQASVIIPEIMSMVAGKVTKISNTFVPQKNGIILYDVEIKIEGTNSLLENTKVSAIVGGMESAQEGKIKTPESYYVVPEISGKVKKVYVSDNEYVQKGQKLFELDRETYERSLRESELDLQSAYLTLQSNKKELEDYNITSPIDGVVLTKNYKAGDSINGGTGTVALMVVANMEQVKFEMNIDELDIAKVEKGQIVNITADALDGEEFTGKVTSVAEEGTSTNGVTNYVVKVVIDEPGKLKSGMNIDATIMVQNKSGVLVIPISAVEKDSDGYYVNVYSQKSTETEKRYIQVGVSDLSNIEVISGLEEGEIVINNSSSSTTNPFGDMDKMMQRRDEQIGQAFN